MMSLKERAKKLKKGRNRKISSLYAFYITTKSEIFQEYHSFMARSIMMQPSGKEEIILWKKKIGLKYFPHRIKFKR